MVCIISFSCLKVFQKEIFLVLTVVLVMIRHVQLKIFISYINFLLSCIFKLFYHYILLKENVITLIVYER